MNITTRDAIDHLNYASYVTQRRLSPHITPSRWGSIFGDWSRFETQYQVDLAAHERATGVLQS